MKLHESRRIKIGKSTQESTICGARYRLFLWPCMEAATAPGDCRPSTCTEVLKILSGPEREHTQVLSGPEEGAYAGCLLDGNYGADNARCVLCAPRDFLASTRIL